MSLEKTFKRANEMPEQDCSFPEPGRGQGKIEHPKSISILKGKRLRGTSDIIAIDDLQFKEALLQLANNGDISKEDLEKILKAEANNSSKFLNI